TKPGTQNSRPTLPSPPPSKGTPLHPLPPLFARPPLPHPVAGNQFLGLGERAIDYGSLLSGELYALGFRGRLQAVARQHDTGLNELLVVLPHLGKDFRIR